MFVRFLGCSSVRFEGVLVLGLWLVTFLVIYMVRQCRCCSMLGYWGSMGGCEGRWCCVLGVVFVGEGLDRISVS